jgi:hypothetical protein
MSVFGTQRIFHIHLMVSAHDFKVDVHDAVDDGSEQLEQRAFLKLSEP